MRQELQAKGGGSAPMIQGNVGATAEALRKCGRLVVPANHSTASSIVKYLHFGMERIRPFSLTKQFEYPLNHFLIILYNNPRL